MRTSIHHLADMKRQGELIGMITAYDYTSARIVDEIGFPAVLVGDSMSQVMLGYGDTVPLTMDESLHHTRAVARGTSRAHVVADMPFLSYNAEWPEAVRNAGRFLKEGGAQSVKVEGGRHMTRAIRRMIAAGIPVMGHLGLTPQSVNQLGGYKVQGRSAGAARRLLVDALALEAAGDYAIDLQLVPAEEAREVTARLTVPTIGIGAGPHCDGQIQVLHDVLGLFEVFVPKHTRRY
ncbi:MAG: 3-methyl-2-oxobutanoate hydroxymethyltransferase, partial [Dehalococcoidia bacterium]|nr:3-methyl-2-oxobutanoate hydroxymethyltransferase [Dehalococcoidia bacterium]